MLCKFNPSSVSVFSLVSLFVDVFVFAVQVAGSEDKTHLICVHVNDRQQERLPIQKRVLKTEMKTKSSLVTGAIMPLLRTKMQHARRVGFFPHKRLLKSLPIKHDHALKY